MRIGMDVSLLLYHEVAGMRLHMERLLEALLNAGSRHQFVLFYHTRRSWHGTDALRRWSAPNVEIVAAPLPMRCVPDSLWWFGYHPPLERLLARPVDVFHAGDFMWPRSARTPLTATLYDLTTVLFPELHVWPNRVRHMRELRWMSMYARRIISISHSSAADFTRHFGAGPAIDVVHPGPGLELGAPDDAAMAAVRAAFALASEPYFLSVGTVEPRKNGERLVQAFDQAFAGRADVPHLVFAGARGWRSDAVYAAAAASPFSSRIHFTGSIATADLVALYHGTTALLYPSLYEGYGLPVLEAMTAGVPVLTSTVSSMPEIAGDHAVLVDPTSLTDIAAGIRALWDDGALRRRLVQGGLERARRFTWKATAQGTLESWAAACGGEP